MPMDETLAAAAVDLGGRPHCVVTRKNRREARRRFPNRTHRRFFPRIRASRARQRSPARRLRPLVASSSRSHVQSLRPRATFRRLARQAPCATFFPARKACCERSPSSTTAQAMSPASNAPCNASAPNRSVRARRNASQQAAALVLPGVGHFAALIRALDERNLRAPLLDAVRNAAFPFLAFASACKRSTKPAKKRPNSRGLQLLPGQVRALPANVKLPHMGWNQLQVCTRTFATTRRHLRRRAFLFRTFLRRGHRHRRRQRSPPAPTARNSPP